VSKHDLFRQALTADEAARFVANALDADEDELCIAGIKELTPDVAKALTRFKGRTLRIDGPTDISTEAATALAKHNGHLALNTLTALTVDVGVSATFFL
jgi:hypothetical protein